jgi:putative flippase GtrA
MVGHPGGAGQAARYVVVGSLGYLITVASYALLVVAGVDYGLAAIIAFLLAITHNFFWNRHWTFEAAAGGQGGQAGRYLVANAVSFGASLALLYTLVEGGLAEIPAGAIAVIVVTPVNFLLQKLWSFRT